MPKKPLLLGDVEQDVSTQLRGYLLILAEDGYRGEAALVAAAILTLTDYLERATQAIRTLAERP